MMSKIEYISTRISYRKHDDVTTLIISPRLQGIQEALLTAWLFCWTACGIIFIWQMFGEYAREQKLYLFIFISFWGYYEYRVGYTWLWKKYGMELIKFDTEAMHYKRSLKKYGKVYKFYYENINSIKPAEIKPNSFGTVLENSFWVIGGEKISFQYLNNEVKIGIQLNEQELTDTIKFIKNEIKQRKNN